MSSRRPIVLMAVLLVLVFGYLLRFHLGFASSSPVARPAELPLAGENTISNVVVRKNDAGTWQASFDYYYTGEPRFARLTVELLPVPDGGHAKQGQWGVSWVPSMKRGANSVTTDIAHPGEAGITRQVLVKMQDGTKAASDPARLVTSAQVDQSIEWPSWGDFVEQQEFAAQSPQDNLQQAIKLIDSGVDENFEEAKIILERLVDADPSLVQAYIELARIAMKANWGPEGLHHAESLLTSARQLEPGNANAKILMGYVYTHQKRHKAAEALFAEAAATNPPNVWLWTNWGESLTMQGRFDQAIAKYRQAVERPMSHDTYDYARAEAYRRLLTLLERKKDLGGMEAIYKASVADFGATSCFAVPYAKFLVQQRGDTAAAIDLSRKALASKCQREEAREALGLAQYVAWARSDGALRAEALNQARIYLPPGPMPFYLLSRSDKTVDVAAKLVAAGEKIDQLDNSRLNALAHAVQDDDVEAARRLLLLGAKPDALVSYDDMPVALMPVMSGNLAMVKLMQQFGADYGKLSYHGATAFDFAKQTGDAGLHELLSQKPQTL